MHSQLGSLCAGYESLEFGISRRHRQAHHHFYRGSLAIKKESAGNRTAIVFNAYLLRLSDGKTGAALGKRRGVWKNKKNSCRISARLAEPLDRTRRQCAGRVAHGSQKIGKGR